jgi:hypothetical protein
MACSRCDYKFNDNYEHNYPYCGISCAILSDDIKTTKIMLTGNDDRKHLLNICVSVEMIRVLLRVMSDAEKHDALRIAVEKSLSVVNAMALTDEMYVINYATDLTGTIPYLHKAEVAKHIITHCANFNADEALKLIVERHAEKDPKLDYNVIFRTTIYLLKAGANSEKMTPQFIDSMLKFGYGNVLAYVGHSKIKSAKPHRKRRKKISKYLTRGIYQDVGSIVMGYVGYDKPIEYRTHIEAATDTPAYQATDQPSTKIAKTIQDDIFYSESDKDSDSDAESTTSKIVNCIANYAS